MLLTKLKLAAVVVMTLAFVGAAAGVLTHRSPSFDEPTNQAPPAPAMPPGQAPERPDLNKMWSQGMAKGKAPVKLTTFPLPIEMLGQSLPMGLVAGGHVTPSDHLYLVPFEQKDDSRIDVVAVADGHVVVIQWRPDGNPDP